MYSIIFVGTGGICGTLLRYWLGKYIGSKLIYDFPIITFLINISGSFILSTLYFSSMFQNSLYHSLLNKIFLTGFLGAYTTFSTFSYESYMLLKSQDYKNMILYILNTLIFGLIASYLGMLTANLF